MDQVLKVFQEVALLLVTLARAAVKSVRENSGLAVLSVVLAFGLWIVVTDAENPTTTRGFGDDIPVQAIRVPPDVALAGPIQPVRVRVTVADDVFDSLTAADFEATVDLDGLTVGEYELPVQVRPLTSRGGLRVEGVFPDTVTVVLAPLASKSVPVVVLVDGAPPAGFTMSAPEPRESTVFVSGAQDQVDQVTQVVARVDVEGRTESLNQAVRLIPQDFRGFLVDGVSVDPPITDVHITIEQQRFTRALAVVPEVIGEPASGYNVVDVAVSPPTVTVQGSRAFIERAVSIPTRPVDIAGATEDVVRTIALDAPSGVSVLGGVTLVTVTVRVEPALGQFTYAVRVSASNLGENLSIQGVLPTVQVALSGPLPVLRSLTPGDILATVDLRNKGAGSHQVEVKVTPPNETAVTVVSPDQVTIVLEQS